MLAPSTGCRLNDSQPQNVPCIFSSNKLKQTKFTKRTIFIKDSSFIRERASVVECKAIAPSNALGHTSVP